MGAEILAKLLYASTAALMRLPWPWLRRAADAMAGCWYRLNLREARVARRNLEIAFPALMPGQRDTLLRDVIRTTARQALETLRLWTQPHRESLALIVETEGLALFEEALASGKGVIVAAPHYGNWELLNYWLAARTPLAILYKPPESRIGEAFLRQVRADSDRVTQVRAEGPAIRQLFKRLRDGGVVGILPDQQPKGGDGEFAPFFGTQALTMTLLGRLAERSDAVVLFAYCERTDGAQAKGDTPAGAPLFALRFDPAPPGIDSADPVTSVTALNQAVEAIARRDPAQYQWTYKRFKRRPKDSGETNPYRDLE